MIIDVIENLEKYVALNPRFRTVCEFLKGNDISRMSNGRHEICGDDVFVNVMDMPAKDRTQAKLETHNEMVDIQLPLSGKEEHGYTPRRHLSKAEYNAAEDISFYDGEAELYFTLRPGYFVIYFPEDGHAPGISSGGVHRAIFKVRK